MIKRKNSASLLFMLPCGILAALPLLFEELALLSFILWTPFCYVIKRRLCRDAVKSREIYAHSLLFFLGYFAAAFSFFKAMYPLDFAGLNKAASVAVILAAMLLLPLFQAAIFSLFTIPLTFLSKRRLFFFPCAFPLFFSSLCLLFFYFQNFTWMGVPWASPALALVELPALSQSASILGSFFLTFLILVFNALLSEAFDAFRECRDKHSVIALSLAAVLFLSNLFGCALLLRREPQGDKEIKVAVLQGDSPIKNERSKEMILVTYKELAHRAADEGATLMLWPESVIHYALEIDPSLQTYFKEVAKETEAIQVVGIFSTTRNEDGEGAFYNSLFLFYPDGTVSEEVYHKRRPVPFGEYLPWADLFELLIPALTEINMLSRNVDAGEGSNLFHTEAGTLGGLICFDSIYPSLARKSVGDGAELILLATNDTWFDGSFGKRLHLSHARLRAIESGRTVLRAANTGYSAIIDEKGQVYASVPCDESGYVTAIAHTHTHTTPYVLMGDVIVYLAAAFVLLCPAGRLLYQKKHKKEKDL